MSSISITGKPHYREESSSASYSQTATSFKKQRRKTSSDILFSSNNCTTSTSQEAAISSSSSQNTAGKNCLLDLPEELLGQIFSHFPVKVQTTTFPKINKVWRDRVSQNDFTLEYGQTTLDLSQKKNFILFVLKTNRNQKMKNKKTFNQ